LELHVGHVLGLVALPVLLVLVGLVHNIALLLHFIVVNVQRLAINLDALTLDRLSCIRGLEANESVSSLTIFLVEKAERLNVAVGLEQISKVLFSCLRSESFNEEIAALLGVLVLESFVLKLLLALSLFKGCDNIKLLATELLSVHLLAGISCALWSILTVIDVIVSVANKGVLLLCVNKERGDLTECFKGLADLGLTPVVWHVLNKDVVEDLAEVGLGFRRELHSDELVLVSRILLEGLVSTLWITEADEAVAA